MKVLATQKLKNCNINSRRKIAAFSYDNFGNRIVGKQRDWAYYLLCLLQIGFFQVVVENLCMNPG